MEAKVPLFPIKAEEKTTNLISDFLTIKKVFKTVQEKKLSFVKRIIFMCHCNRDLKQIKRMKKAINLEINENEPKNNK